MAVEFALLLPILILLVMGGIDWGYYFFIQQVATNAAREAARAGSVVYPTGDTGTPAYLKAKEDSCAAAKGYLASAGYSNAQCLGRGSGTACQTTSTPTICTSPLNGNVDCFGVTHAQLLLPADKQIICVQVVVPIGDRGSITGVLSSIMPRHAVATSFMRWE